MQIKNINKIVSGEYLNYYHLTYENKAKKKKIYEMVSRQDIRTPEDIGVNTSAVVLIAFCQSKILLLKEFRLAVNRPIYNFAAGLIDDGETVLEAAQREMKEETGLTITKVYKILPAAFGASGISDEKNVTIFCEVDGTFTDSTSFDEEIKPVFVSKNELKMLLETEEFASRTQLFCWCYAFS